MSVLDDGAFAPLRPTERRPLGCGAGFALAAAVAFLFHRAAPGAPAMSAGFAGVSGLAALALAFTLDDAALPGLTKALAAGVGLLVLCALVGPEPRLTLASFASGIASGSKPSPSTIVGALAPPRTRGTIVT